MFEVFAHHSGSHRKIVKQLEANNKDNKPEQKQLSLTLCGASASKERKPGQIVNATVNNNT